MFRAEPDQDLFRSLQEIFVDVALIDRGQTVVSKGQIIFIVLIPVRHRHALSQRQTLFKRLLRPGQVPFALEEEARVLIAPSHAKNAHTRMHGASGCGLYDIHPQGDL